MQELGLFDSPDIIKFGHWDSLNKGLLAGDKLIHQLHKLDAAYIDNNKRTFELTKHISLAQMFPDKLLTLISEKIVTLELPEWIFDMDYPGQYMRRIKSVAVTIPNVAGPNTNISLKLSLTGSAIRTESTGGLYPYDTFKSTSCTICTSSAQNDSGMFELNFGDERYLPFENTGTISRWTLEFPGHNQFDLSSISDVILHINYTALQSEDLKQSAIGYLDEVLPTSSVIIFNPKQDFPDVWNNMNDQYPNMSFEIKTDNIPFYLKGFADQLKTNTVTCVLTSKKELENPEKLLIIVTKGLSTSNCPGFSIYEEKCGEFFIYKSEFDFDNIPDTLGKYEFDFDFSETDMFFADIEECIVALTNKKQEAE